MQEAGAEKAEEERTETTPGVIPERVRRRCATPDPTSVVVVSALGPCPARSLSPRLAAPVVTKWGFPFPPPPTLGSSFANDELNEFQHARFQPRSDPSGTERRSRRVYVYGFF